MPLLPLTAALLATSPLPPSDFAAQIDHVGFINGKDDVELIAYDHEGQIVATITLWIESNESVWLISEYTDGSASFTVFADDAVTFDSTLSRELVEDRAEAIFVVLGDYPGPLVNSLSCALSIADSVIDCAADSGNCSAASIATACDCLPRMVQNWQTRSC